MTVDIHLGAWGVGGAGHTPRGRGVTDIHLGAGGGVGDC